MPEISIVVPIYNAEKMLSRCVDSILGQSFADFELILVDDGSTDASLDICREYEKQDERVRLLHQENMGVSAARNAGIDMTSGNYLMFCDSDDYVAENWCEMLLAVIKENKDAWVVSNAFRKNIFGESSLIDDLKQHPKSATYADIYFKYLSPYLWNKIYNAAIIREYGIRFRPDVELGEDILFNIGYYKLCSSVSYIPEPLYYYCENSKGAVQKYRPDRFEQDSRLFQARLPLIQEEELAAFCDRYLWFFMELLRDTFDSRNPMSRAQKMRYNQRMMNSEAFRYCVKHASGEKESALYMRVLRLHNYRIYRLLLKLTV